MESFWGTTNLKVAAAATAFGATLRQLDPVTCIVKEGGQRQVTFWFSSSGPDGDEARAETTRDGPKTREAWPPAPTQSYAAASNQTPA